MSSTWNLQISQVVKDKNNIFKLIFPFVGLQNYNQSSWVCPLKKSIDQNWFYIVHVSSPQNLELSVAKWYSQVCVSFFDIPRSKFFKSVQIRNQYHQVLTRCLTFQLLKLPVHSKLSTIQANRFYSPTSSKANTYISFQSKTNTVQGFQCSTSRKLQLWKGAGTKVIQSICFKFLLPKI